MSSDVNACGLCNDGLSDVLIIFNVLNNVFIKFQLKLKCLDVAVVVVLTIKLKTQSLTKYESPKPKNNYNRTQNTDLIHTNPTL